MIMQQLLEMIFGLGPEEAGNLLAFVGEKTLHNLKNASDWKKILVDTGQFFIENEKNADQFFDDLAVALSKKNMQQVAKESKDLNGYELKDKLIQLLMQLMNKYEIPHELAESYCMSMLYSILEQIKTVEPKKYDQYFQKEWRDEQEKSLKALETKLDKMSTDMQEYQEHRLEIASAGQMDIDLRRQTISPSIGIDFFKIDDEEFQKNFKDHLHDKLIFVKGKCREETIYCILNELWKSEECRPIYIVKSLDSWEKLRELSTENNIYIPWFCTESIVAIENNTNIFVLNENMPAYSQNVINLRPRTFDTLLRSLRDAGMEYSDAYTFLSDTHGLYIPMKKRLFNGQYLKIPEWVEGLSNKAKKTCLLIGQWEEIDGDIAVIESLYGDTYEVFIDEVLPYTIGEDPFLYSIRNRRVKSYSLASTENTWECVDISMDDPLWAKFIDIFIEVINESEALFTYSGEERLLAQWKGEKLFWSETIRRGMIRTLIMKGYYRNTEKCQPVMDQLMETILGYVKDEKQWVYISHFWTDLCEISPKAVLNRMSQELDDSTGLLTLFQNQSKNFIIDRNAYIDILWGIEQFLTQEEFAWDALRWLLKLDNHNYKYVSNSPKNTLEKVFCPWYNFSAIRQPEDKIKAARLACELSGNAWKYLCDAISHSGRSMVGTLSTPKYRDHLSEQETSISDFQAVTEGYFGILLEKMEFSVERWSDMLTLTEDLPSLQRENVFNILLNELNQMSDDEIIQIKNKIRDIIYRHRYFSSSSWAMSEDQLQEYERLLNDIHTSQPEYEYEYLFRTGLNSPLLHPVPYDEKKAVDKANEVETDKLIHEKMEEFQNNRYDLEFLAKICSTEKECPLGRYLARFWGKGEWDLDIFKTLLSVQETGEMAIDYMVTIFKNDVSHYPDVIAQVKKWGYSDELLSSLYRAEAVWTENLPLVEKTSDEIKLLFWRTPLPLKGDAARWAADESKKYADLVSFLFQLHWLNNEKTLNAQEIYSYFEDIESMRHTSSNQMSGWYMQQFLDILQQEFLYDDEKCFRISQIEIHFMNLIGWDHMKCFSRVITENPEVFSQLIAGIFKRDHESEECLKGDTQLFRNMYTLYDKAHFCPAERDGEVNAEDLSQWVERFKILLKENDQESYFGSTLGRLFSFSPIGKDGHKPCESVRAIIEQYSDDKMIQGYVTSVFNQRGIYNPSAGTEEMQMAREFMAEAEYFKPKWPKTAEIFYKLYHSYKLESEQARLEAENGHF